jgi:hypothetical protein
MSTPPKFNLVEGNGERPATTSAGQAVLETTAEAAVWTFHSLGLAQLHTSTNPRPRLGHTDPAQHNVTPS